MTITLDLRPEIEKDLRAQATAHGVSLIDYVNEIVVQQAHRSSEPAGPRRTGQALIDACAKVRGLLTNEEVDALFSRSPSVARPLDFE